MIYLALGFFGGGVLGGLLLGESLFVMILLVLLLVLGFCVVQSRFWKKSLLLGIMYCLGFWRGDGFEVEKLAYDQTQVVTILGRVAQFSESKRDLRRYTLEVTSLEIEGMEMFLEGKKMYLYLPYYRSFDPGTSLSVLAQVREIEPFLTETGRVFFYDRFLETKDIIGAIYYPLHVQKIQEDSIDPSFILRIKKSFIHQMNQIFSFPNAPLLAGVLLGAVDTLGEERLDNFRIAGLIHIVVLSGSNVAIIIEAVRRSIPVKRMYSVILSGIFIFLFVMMVGPEASIVRASIMAYIGLLAQATYSRYSVYRSLWITAGGMTAYNPGILLYDPGFILSFLATIGMVYLNPFLEKKLTFIPERFELRFIISSTCATYIAVLPYITYSMGKVSVVSLGVNLISLPLVPWVMLGGFVSSVVSYGSDFLAKPIVFLTESLLLYIQEVVKFSANLPFAEVSLTVSLAQMLSMYGIGVGVIWWVGQRRFDI